ncbi:MAG: hypothetical protein QOE61_3712, partial [Micromonosporaceae bacterium]|nr:hypothetical protein [Micromonosporaceae bacterium]
MTSNTTEDAAGDLPAGQQGDLHDMPGTSHVPGESGVRDAAGTSGDQPGAALGPVGTPGIRPVGTPAQGRGLPLRARVATSVSKTAAALSRVAGRGDGSVIGGWIGLKIDPELLTHLAAGRQVALVSGTNGKTTTTRLTAAAMGVLGDVATNSLGANMPTGHTSALARAGYTPYAVLEVDEHYLDEVMAATTPHVVALLNLSRDQLDRAKEVAMMASSWRDALRGLDIRIVANADDPMVVWAARDSATVWVASGQRWHDDSWVCPECGSRIERSGEEWWCTTGDLRRPLPQWEVRDGGV